MNTKSAMKLASLSVLTVGLLTSFNSFAETNTQEAGAAGASHALVHRVSHSLASDRTYSQSGNAGYKWAKNTNAASDTTAWAHANASQAGYKWASAESRSAASSDQGYAAAANYQWGSMNFSEQAAYKWGLRSFSDQSAYKWGLRSFSDQTAYKWGLRSFADQSAYKWGLR